MASTVSSSFTAGAEPRLMGAIRLIARELRAGVGTVLRLKAEIAA